MDPTDATVAAVSEAGPDAIALEVETPAEFEARPGQFVRLSVPVDGEQARFYTISSPNVSETFELTISIDPEGEVTPHLRDLEAGSTVTISGPYGDAYYEDESRVLVVAGGPGVGPAVGIAERVLDDGGTAAIVYRDETPIHEERLSALAARGADVSILGPADSLDGPVAEALTDDTQVFVYGFADFLDAATAAIEAAGGDADEAKLENFG